MMFLIAIAGLASVQADDVQYTECQVGNQVVKMSNRCGPKFEHAFCDGRYGGDYCNESNGWCGNTAAHKNAQASTKYDTASLPAFCHQEKRCKMSNRCGPLFEHSYCDGRYGGDYCNEANGWCGNTAAHKNAQASTKYDTASIPAFCLQEVACKMSNRCGPKFEHSYCVGENGWIYCNESNGWCGKTDAHKNAQASTKYDTASIPDFCLTSKPTTEPTGVPTKELTAEPTGSPTGEPSTRPTLAPSPIPTYSTCQVGDQIFKMSDRCGPKFEHAFCDGRYGVDYCNESNGWCGNTAAHKNAQISTKYDTASLPAFCHQAEPCKMSNRCGPKFGHSYCVGENGWIYCNEDNGWCGKTDAHKNAQASTKYDTASIPDVCLTPEPTAAPTEEITTFVHFKAICDWSDADTSKDACAAFCGGKFKKGGCKKPKNPKKIKCKFLNDEQCLLAKCNGIKYEEGEIKKCGGKAELSLN